MSHLFWEDFQHYKILFEMFLRIILSVLLCVQIVEFLDIYSIVLTLYYLTTETPDAHNSSSQSAHILCCGR